LETDFRCPACGWTIPDEVDLEHGSCGQCGSSFGPAFEAAQGFASSHVTPRDREHLASIEERGWAAEPSAEELIAEARYSQLLRQAFNSYSPDSVEVHSRTQDPLYDAVMFTRWEYCRLEVETRSYSSMDRVQQTVTLTWLGPRGYQVQVAVAGDDASWTLAMNPWDYTLGSLGDAGWELVSIQHADQTNLVDVYSMDVPYVAWDRALAIFKRPVVSGRPIDDTVLFR